MTIPTVLLTIVLAALLVAVARRPLVGLLAYLAFDTLRLHQLWPELGRLRPMLLLGAVTVGAALWRSRADLRRIVRAMALPALVLGYAAASLLWSVDRAATASELFEIAKVFTVFAVVLLVTNDRRGLLAVVWTLALSLAVLGGQAIVHAYRAGLMKTFSVQMLDPGIHDNNDAARLLALAIPLWWLLWTLGGRAQRVVAALGLAAVLLGLVSTFSRGGFVTAVGVVVLLVAFARRGQRLGGLLAAGLLAAASLVPAPYVERVETVVVAPRTEASVRGREAIWSVGRRMFAERPLVGGGLDSFKSLYAEQEPGLPPRAAHNVYLEVAVELGAVGLLAYLALYGSGLASLVRIGWRVRGDVPAPWESAVALALGASLAGFLAASFLLSKAFLSTPLMVLALGSAAGRLAPPRPEGA